MRHGMARIHQPVQALQQALDIVEMQADVYCLTFAASAPGQNHRTGGFAMATNTQGLDPTLILNLFEKVETWEHLFTPTEYFNKNGPEDWFYYFFAEAKYAIKKGKGSKQGLRQAGMVQVISDLFDVNPEHLPKTGIDVQSKPYGSGTLSDISGGDPMAMLKMLRGAKNRGGLTINDKRVFRVKEPFSAIAARSPERLREAMCILLEIGFKKLIADPNALIDPSSLAIDDQERFQRQMDKEYLINVVRSADSICWRGDLRGWYKIWESRGITRRVENDEEYNNFNLSQQWHPYSDPEYKKYYWFRYAQGDNCYHATLSIGVNSNWKAVVAFPKLDDLRKRPEYIGTVTATIDRPGPTGDNTITLEATCTTLYLFVAGGLSVNTRKLLQKRNAKFEQDTTNKGGTFPEFGVKGIPFDSIYGWAQIVRIWHEKTDAGGFTLFVRSSPFTRRQYDLVRLNERLFGEALPALEKAFESIANVHAPMCAAWGPTGYTEQVTFKWPAPLGTDEDKRIAAKITSFRWIKKPANL
jgi:hypothetical protein